jgi:hypothetical protein
VLNDWHLNNSTKQSLIGFVTEELIGVIDENKDGWITNTVHYKVKTEYSDESFYLNKVDGSFDESLHMLIHRIMYVENKHVVGSNDPDKDLSCYYLMFIHPELFHEIDENPNLRWWIDFDHEDFGKVDEFLSDIYYQVIHNVYKYMKEIGIDLKDDFEDYLDP